jgi:hypothetical protein
MSAHSPPKRVQKNAVFALFFIIFAMISIVFVGPKPDVSSISVRLQPVILSKSNADLSFVGL